MRRLLVLGVLALSAAQSLATASLVMGDGPPAPAPPAPAPAPPVPAPPVPSMGEPPAPVAPVTPPPVVPTPVAPPPAPPVNPTPPPAVPLVPPVVPSPDTPPIPVVPPPVVAPPVTPPPVAPPPMPKVVYAGPDDVKARLESLVGPRAQLGTYGTSAGGRPLLVLRIGRADRPQVLVHGGVGDRDAAGTAAALDFAERVARAPAEGSPGHDPLEKVGFLVIPAPNPDALAGFLAGTAARGGGNVDRDRDGKLGEDGPDDLDGDGEIVLMRRRRPEGTFVVPDTAPKPDGKKLSDPRMMDEAGIDARRAKSYEKARPEGRDDDGDGDVDEDPPGLDLTRQFMGVWEEMGAWQGDGPFPGFAPEVRALMELSFETANLVGWYAFVSEGPRLERASERGNAADADDALYGRLATAWKSASSLELRKASERPGASNNPGSELDWAAKHLGVPALRIPVWRIAKEDANGRERADPDELDWLLWNDRVLGGKGFVAWHEVKHPQLGIVEIGGWKRFTRHEPPADHLEASVRAVSGVPLAHAAFVPELDVLVETEALGAGIVRVRARVANVGGGPTETQRSRAALRAMEIRLDLEAGGGVERTAGPVSASVGHLEAGEISSTTEWLVRRPATPVAGGPAPFVRIRARHRIAGTVVEEVALP